MAKNTSREFATMDEEERRRFALEPDKGEDADQVRPLDFAEDDPRNLPSGEEKSGGDGSGGRQ
jgi:hypothetical protein